MILINFTVRSELTLHICIEYTHKKYMHSLQSVKLFSGTKLQKATKANCLKSKELNLIRIAIDRFFGKLMHKVYVHVVYSLHE